VKFRNSKFEIRNFIGAPERRGRGQGLGAAAVLVAATAVVYANSFGVPFLLDDRSAIAENPSIRSLLRLGRILRPPDLSSTGGRPLLNLSLAANYAWSGEQAWGYHLANLLVHICAGLVLFGIVRRTLQLPALRGRYQSVALPLGFLTAALWMLHPLQTEAVTYISQRAESLMGLFYLLALYCFIRSVESLEVGRRVPARPLSPPELRSEGVAGARRPTSYVFAGLSILACLLGTATKEVMMTAPLVVLLYDRAFISRSFLEAIGRRPRYYLGLAASWLFLGFLIVGTHLGHRSIGFQSGVSGLSYALTELKVVAKYLALSIWPHPLVFDYGPEVLVAGFRPVAGYALLVLAAVIGAAIAWRRSKPLGFLAISFFILLAPTSSFVPIPLQPMAESRMYLPLASVVTIVALAAYAACGRRAFAFLAIAAVALGLLTFRRNRDYRSAVSIWEDTIAKWPETSRGQYSLGVALGKTPGREPEAIAHYEEALRLKPDYAEAQGNYAIALAQLPGREPEALAHFEESLRLDPSLALIHFSYGAALEKIPGRAPEAIAQYEQALEITPDYPEAENNLANLLIATPGRESDGLAHYAHALSLHPDNAHVRFNLAQAHCNLANRLVALPGRASEAIGHYEQAVRIEPDYVQAHFNLGAVYANTGRYADATDQWKTVLSLDPGNAQAQKNIAMLATLQKGTH